MELVDRMLAGDSVALAKLMTALENRSAQVPDIMRLVHSHLGHSYRVGITGPPGAGKSTLVDKLTACYRQQQATVGVVAIDPTSPFSGGALLGDRIRMQQHYLDKGVFIRSMGSRGSHGGLARATKDVVSLLDAFGKDYVLVETVGVGQTELDVAAAADTVVVILVPEAGDAVQTMKAGLMEIADIFVINKADRGGAEQMQMELQIMLHMNGPKRYDWEVPVLLAEAERAKGIPELCQAIDDHRQAMTRCNGLTERRQEHSRADLIQILEEKIRDRLIYQAEADSLFASYLARVETGELDPYSAAIALLSEPARVAEMLTERR